VRLEQARAIVDGALRKIVEGKADHRRGIAHLERVGVQMHRQPVADLHPCF
jgi:predicted RNA-binding protein